MNFFIQILGMIAWGLLTVSYWQKKKLNLIVLQLIAYILYAIHFALLDGLSGALCNIAGIIVLFLLLIKEKSNKKSYWMMLLILLLYIPIGIYSYSGLYSILPILASIIPLMFNWQKNIVVIKIGGIIGSLFWLIYALFVNSYSTIITEIIFIISTVVALFFNNKKKLK